MEKKDIPVIRVAVYNGPVNFLSIQHKRPVRVLYVWKLEQLDQALTSLSDGETVILNAWFVIVHYYPEKSMIDIVEGPYENRLSTRDLSISKASDLLKDYDKDPVFEKPIHKNQTNINFS